MNSYKALFLLPLSASIMITACGGGSGNHQTITTTGSNVQSITVNAGPDNDYVNGAFTSVVVCVPGTSNCQTIAGILVDTGSFGLRIVSSQLSVALPQQAATDGNPVAECAEFVDSYTWGPVKTADIQISGETASSVPVQVLSDTDYPVPSGCSGLGVPSADTLGSLHAAGILGVGNFVQDCGTGCTLTGSANPGLYYECPASGCVVTSEAVNNQVTNPVALFSTDNNGVIVELPGVAGEAATLTGSLVFGIGTQSNNGLGSASVYTLNQDADITTQYNGSSYPESFLDSGSNGIFFLDSSATGFPECGGFYCPNSTQNLSATNAGANGTNESIKFSVADAENLFDTNGTAFDQLAGPGGDAFDWGLSFFYGRNVFTAIDGASTPGGPGPYWAY
jgi:Protein of unknown function (DUF3443)